MSDNNLPAKKWIFAGHCVDGNRFLIDGVNVWSRAWQNVPGQSAQIKDPLYGQDFSFPVYTIQDGEKEVRFAAGEFSNTIWGFYVLE